MGQPVRDAIRKRLVRFGEAFTSDELERGDVELEQVEAAPEPPPEEQGEPWALLADAGGEPAEEAHHSLRDRFKGRHHDTE